MIANYLITALRSLLRQKLTSSINILGLSVGIGCSLLILFWVEDEVNYDTFNKNSDFIYRVTAEGFGMQVATSMAGMGPAFESDLAEVSQSARLFYATHLMKQGDVIFEEKKVLYADPSFFDIFSYGLLAGDAKTLLNRPDGIVFTKAMANKYFGDDNDIVGKTVMLDNKDLFTVVGILDDIPSNSHLQFDFVLPIAHLAKTDYDLKESQWENFKFYTYLLVDHNLVPTPDLSNKLEKAITEIYRKHSDETAKQVELHLQPLDKIHLHSNLMMDVTGHGSIQNVNMLTVSGIIILVVACINFMNLSTARASKRAKEVGLRKVVGAERSQLVTQFLGESFLITLISLGIAFFIVALVLPSFNDLANKSISFEFTRPNFLAIVFIVFVFSGLVSGGYPALFLSGFNPTTVLKGNFVLGKSNLAFRNTLVVIQFIVSIILIIGTTVIYQQMQFVQGKDLGFDKENLVTMPLVGNLIDNQRVFRTELESRSSILEYSISDALPTNLVSATSSIDWEGKDPGQNYTIPNISIDKNFLDVFEIKLISGRGFSEEFVADSSNILVNQEFVKLLNSDSSQILGKRITLWGKQGTVIGVVKNFHYKSLQHNISPLILAHLNGPGFHVTVRPQSSTNEKVVISELESISRQLNPQHPFSFNFLSQDLLQLYNSQRSLNDILSVFAMLGIVVSCLGLYGLSAFTAEQRRKEIGIRKTLGASSLHIIYILSKRFSLLLLLAIIVAVPTAWVMMTSWLEGFTYHVSVGVGTVILACMIALIVALLTLSYESIKAALVAPIKSIYNK